VGDYDELGCVDVYDCEALALVRLHGVDDGDREYDYVCVLFPDEYVHGCDVRLGVIKLRSPLIPKQGANW
jgi:hypothetical protein